MKKLLLFFVTMLMSVTATWAEDVTLQDDGGGTKYVNMPKTGTNTLTLPDASVKYFKVYDDGGPYVDEENRGYYSNYCEGYLIITAPSGYRVQVSGTICAESCDYLTIYDGTTTGGDVLLNQKSSPTSYELTDIGTVNSSGQSLMLYFYSDYSNNHKGLDLEVTLFDPNEAYAITINTVEGGALTADKVTAKFGETVTLNETHESGYSLKETIVKDIKDRIVEVTGGTWYNKVGTFTMPASTATVNPVFTAATTIADGLFLTIPKTGTFTTDIATGVKSFKVYDHGGIDNNYDTYCDGYLLLNVPDGYRIQVTGTANSEPGCDYLTIYDGTEVDEAKILLKKKSSTTKGEPADIGIITSSGRSLLLYFYSDSSQETAGLDLNVYVFNPNEAHAITIATAEGGVMTADKETAKFGEHITLSETHTKGYALLNTTAIDANGTPVEINGGTWYNAETSFDMPISAVTVTPTFTNATTAADGLFINMLKEGTITTNITNGIKSFKVYDNGGAENTYSPNCQSYLQLTAPIGYRLQISGTIASEPGCDYLTIYDGTEIDDAKLLLDKKTSAEKFVAESIGEFTSTGRSLLVFFRSDSSQEGAGLDLTVTLVPITYTLAFDNGQTGATGTMAITGSMENITLTYDEAQSLPAVGFSRTAYNFTGWSKAIDGEVVFADKAEVENLATEQGAVVTIYGKWTPIVYPITYTLGEGAALPDGKTNPTEYTIETADFTLTNPTKLGYTFAGWTGTGLTDKTIDVTVSLGNYGNREYIANWTPNPYKVHFNANNGTGEMADQNFVYDAAQALTMNAFTRRGYTFEGWNTKADGSGVAYADKASVKNLTTEANATINLYAQWKIITYTLTYDLAGGSVATENPATYTVETENFTLTNPTKTGYTFAGWTGTDLTEATTTVTIAKGTIDNRSYTATWTPNPYKVHFNANNGTGEMADQNFVYDAAQALTANAFTRKGYTFEGWNTKADGSGEAYTDKASVKNLATEANAIVNLYAQWQVITYTLTYDLAGGSVATANPTEYTIETAAFTLTNPTKDHYVFAGWTGTDLSDATMSVTIAKGSTGDRSYTATWEKETYVVNLTSSNPELVTLSTTAPQYQDNVVVTINNSTAAELIEFTVDGVNHLGDLDSEGKYTITNVQADVEVVVNFSTSTTVAVLAQEWATFVANKAVDFFGTGLTAYIVTGRNTAGTAVILEEVSTVPANTPVVLNGTTGSYTIPYVASSATDVSANLLKRGTGGNVDAGTGVSRYVLSAQGATAVFKKIGATPAPVSTDKAYLEINESSGAPLLSIEFGGGTTGIFGISGISEQDEIYDMQGRKVEHVSKKGLYIINGKKVVIK